MNKANRLVVQVRGKKNLVIERSLAGPIGIFVKFSTLQDYGVDKVFFLENGNADVSQRNVVFIARGESAKHAQSIAGTLPLHPFILDLALSFGEFYFKTLPPIHFTLPCSSPKWICNYDGSITNVTSFLLYAVMLPLRADIL